MKRIAILLLIAFGAACCGFAQQGPDLSAIDKSADPCQDFYQYACGGWMKAHPIPADESRWGRFNELNQRNQTILRGILEDAAKNQNRSETDQKIGAFYQSCMDEAKIEQLGTSPLQEEMDRIAKVDTPAALLDEIARLQERQINVFFRFSPSPDLKDARMMIADLDQGGLGLPERDYYFRDDPKSVELRKQYVGTIAKTFELAGVAKDEAAKKAATVMSIETDLAKASLDVTTRRDPQKLFHQMPVAEVAKLSPNFDFESFFKQVNAPSLQKINVSVPDFVKAFSALVAARSMGDLRDYLAWHYLHASSPLLTKAFVDTNFDFYGRALFGQKEMKPRWRRCVAATDDELGEALGKKYVEKTFGEQGKQRTLEMVHEIEQEMGKDLESISWMTPATKKQALVKLHAVANKIGYPDKWRDYSALEIRDGDYFGNTYRANEFEYRRELNKMGKPVDRSEWEMTPPTVNAYYEPTQNNINFPAGILQPPFYSNQADDAVNYGAIGAVVGHELTHAFDDEGRQFDADGNLKDWWQKQDEERFNSLAECTVNEYGSFSPVTGVELNGKLTLGENTADNGGVRLAYMALMDDLAKKSIPVSEKTEGYTEAQQFFLGYAQDWCENETPEMSRFMAQNDPHSPGRFRVDGVVKNMPEFSQAFGCKAGDKMYVAKGRGCRVW
ncbi:MAG TPA: M13 family metallopeptidase [Bryobacteraceae bacterium]|jgi:endothelin-converting enzyme/putative endopeptidase|nr:M13 family metallopeptidase [Bryobacteraceae bacterium]